MSFPLPSPALTPDVTALFARGAAFLGCPLPILGGAMTWVSERHLVSAISNAGAFGVLACGAMPPPRLAEEIRATRALTDKPFGVNLILMHPQLAELLAVCVAEKVRTVVLAGGMPKAAAIRTLKDGGVQVLAFAPALALAKRLFNMGVDGLIIEGSEAGGHIGAVSTSVLAQEILPHLIEVPVFVAGGIGHGQAVAAYLRMGAAGCQLGTRFVCSTECTAHPRFKQAFIQAQARDAVVSHALDPRFPVIPVRALANGGTEQFRRFQQETIDKVNSGALSLKEGQLAIEHYWAGALRRAVIEGDIESGSLMAGQSVGMVTREMPVAEILAEIKEQLKTLIKNN